MNFNTTAVGVLVCGLLASNAFAQTLPVVQTGNISVDNDTDTQFLTVNWDDGLKNIGLLQFDLSAYASFSGTATLNLFHQWNDGNALGQNAVFNLYQNTSSWDSSIVFWADRPSHDPTPTATLDGKPK